MSDAKDKLEYTLETKQLIREAIEAQGIELADDATFRSYADAIKGLTEKITELIDGEWTPISSQICNLSSLEVNREYSFQISSLPEDGNAYEVVIVCEGNTGTNGLYNFFVSSSLVSSVRPFRIAPTNANISTGGTLTIPVGSDRTIKFSCGSLAMSTMIINLKAYRRLGKNK